MQHIRLISKNVLAMGITSFFNDISSEMIYPIIPFFITITLGASVEVVGFIEGAAVLTYHLVPIVAGLVSDRLGKRKPFVVFGYSISSLSKVLFVVAHRWWVVCAGRVGDRFGKGMRVSAKDALMAASTSAPMRGVAYGFDRAVDTGGAIVGPLLSLLLLGWFPGQYRLLFGIAVVPALIGLYIFATHVRDIAPVSVPQNNRLHMRALMRLDGPYRKFLLVSGLFALGNSSQAFLLLRAHDFGFSSTMVVLVYTLSNAVYALTALPCGMLADRIGPRRVLMAGFVLFAVVYGCFGFITHTWMVWVLFALYGLFLALTEGVAKVYISLLIAQNHQGTAFGMYQGVLGVSMFFASFIAGILWKQVGVQAPFIFGSAMALAATILFTFFNRIAKSDAVLPE